MKKILNKFLIILILMILFNILNKSYIFATDEVATGTCGENITWSLDSNGILKISGTGNMSGNECAWKEYAEQIKSVEFSGNITSISNNAFEFNSNIETIILPTNVSSIGTRAFAECTNLKSIIIPEKLSSIGTSAFYKCSSLESIELSENLLYIRNYAFAECTSLKSITVKAIYTSIGDSELTISDTAQIYGYKDTSIFQYARCYGRTFTDLNTNETTTVKTTNQSFLDCLPTENLEALGPTSHGSSSWVNNTIQGFSPSFCYESDTTNEKYQEIKAKVDELTKECTTDTEKANNIFKFVASYIEYVWGQGASANIDRVYSIWESKNRVYSIWESKKGNCEAYTLLTNYMLYLCGIPTGTATSMDHQWSLAYVDGKWINIDSTQYRFGDTSNKIYQVSFAYDGVIYVIVDTIEGGKIAGIAKTSDEVEKLTTFTIPNNSYTKGIYETAFPTKIELRADINTIGAEFVEKNRPYHIIENNQIIGSNEEIVTTYTTIPTKEILQKEVMIFNSKTDLKSILTIENFPVLNKYQIKLYDATGDEKLETEKLGSKNVIKIKNSSNEVLKEYTIIVLGDINGDGQVKMYDAFSILKDTLFGGNLNEIDTLIRDYNGDEKVKMYDAFSFLKQSLFN